MKNRPKPKLDTEASSFAEAIEDFRTHYKLTKQGLSHISGSRRWDLSRYELGYCLPNEYVVENVLFSLQADYLLTCPEFRERLIEKINKLSSCYDLLRFVYLLEKPKVLEDLRKRRNNKIAKRRVITTLYKRERQAKNRPVFKKVENINVDDRLSRGRIMKRTLRKTSVLNKKPRIDLKGKRGNLTPIESSQIEAIGYTPEKSILQIQFKPSKRDNESPLYEYYNFPEAGYEKLESASSPGSYLFYHIKGQYAYRKIGWKEKPLKEGERVFHEVFNLGTFVQLDEDEKDSCIIAFDESEFPIACKREDLFLVKM